MAKNDFFSFITSLTPMEKKAIGGLSQVIHLEEGATIQPGPGRDDALYIISRGAMEVVHADPRYAAGAAISYLSRGDMFGETSALSGLPSRNAFRACERTSVQVFRKRDFAELTRRVPGFFFHLSQALASRLVQVSDMAFMQSNCLELSGNLANFDLVTIYQTILNASQTGELSVKNDTGERVASFFFQSGQPKFGRYYNLLGEQAFWQLFLHAELTGTFAFALCEEPAADLAASHIIQRHPTDMLITALQYRDEFKELAERAPDLSCVIQRACLNLSWDHPEFEDVRALAERLWTICYNAQYTVAELYQQLAVNERDYYKTLLRLIDSAQFTILSYETPQLVMTAPAVA